MQRKGRPPSDTPNKRAIAITLSPHIIEWIDSTGMYRSEFIEQVLQEKMETQPMKYTKLLTLTAGSRSNPVHAQVEFTGTLTANVAVEAAKRAFGHANGVTVCDPDTMTKYRVTRGKAKDITDPEESAQAMMEQAWREQAAKTAE